MRSFDIVNIVNNVICQTAVDRILVCHDNSSEAHRDGVHAPLMLYLGVRRGDAVRLGKQHVRNGAVHFANKTRHKKMDAIELPVLSELARIIAASPMWRLDVPNDRIWQTVHSAGVWPLVPRRL